MLFLTGCMLLFLLTIVVLLNTTAASAGSRIQQTDTTPVHQLPVVKLGKTDPLAETIEQIGDARVILVGETHTRYDHHLVQLEILKKLYQKSPKLALGVEWFQQPFQQHLDDYIAGRISENEMLHLTEYFERWRYDYRLYQPLIQYARQHNIPIIALNASKELSNALGEFGVDDLPDDLQAQLPTSYDWSDKAYEERLRVVFEAHPEYAGEFKDFVRGQLTWDESMAERAAKYLTDNPESRMLILAGSGHIEYGSGIPNRIKRRIDAEQFSILVSENHLSITQDSADFLVLSQEQSLQPAGLIGAYLDTNNELVVIKEFTHNSAAKNAGVAKGAIIVGVDDVEVNSFTDFKLALLNKKPGESIELHYLENADASEKDRDSVELELR
jgi:uncharacterized iron-regulated protein